MSGTIDVLEPLTRAILTVWPKRALDCEDCVSALNALEASSLIRARGSTVWEVITDAGNFPVWGSGITCVSGDVRNGVILRIRTSTLHRANLLVEQTPEAAMTWTRGAPPLCAFVRTFSLTPHNEMTLLVVKDELFGPLRGIVSSPWPFTAGHLAAFVTAITERAELLG